MKRRIGIVIDKWRNGQIDGHIVDMKVNLEINENCGVDVSLVPYEKHFTLNTKTQILITNVFINWEDSKEIAINLKKLGFDNVKLQFNDVLYYFDENNQARIYEN